jgi:hypothetical protein
MSDLSQDLLARTHSITIANANALITNFTAKKKDIEDGDYEDSEPLFNAESFNKEALLRVLNQEGCIGIRFYNGFNTENKIVLVATGIDSDGNDLNLGVGTNPAYSVLLQSGQPCPNWCMDDSLINQ